MVIENRRPAARVVRKDRGTIYDRVAEARARRAAAAEGSPSDPPPPGAAPAPREADASATARSLQDRARESLPVTAEPPANHGRAPEPDAEVELVPEIIAPPEQPRELLPAAEPPPAPQHQRGASNLPALVPAEAEQPSAPARPRMSWRSEALQWLVSAIIVAAIALGVMWSGRTATSPLPSDEVSTTIIRAPESAEVAAVSTATAEAPEPADVAATEPEAADTEVEALRASLAETEDGAAGDEVEALRERLAAAAETQPQGDAAAEAAASEEAVARPLPAGSDVRVILHAPRSVPDERVGLLADALGEAGVNAEVRAVNMTITRDNVRFYHPEDREAASVVAQAMDADLRDFTDFTPSPPDGLIEVWVAGEEVGGSSSGTATRSGTLSDLRGDLRAMARDLRRALR